MAGLPARLANASFLPGVLLAKAVPPTRAAIQSQKTSSYSNQFSYVEGIGMVRLSGNCYEIYPSQPSQALKLVELSHMVLRVYINTQIPEKLLR